MNVIGWIKKFCFKVLNKIEDHLVTFVTGAILFVIIIFGGFFKNWLIIEHSLELYGWVWLLITLVLIILSVCLLRSFFQNFRRIKDPSDIRNVLSKWWRHIGEQHPDQLEFTLYFSSIDKKERLKKGSAKKYLRAVVIKDGVWGVVREGSDTLLVKRDSPVTQEYTE